MREDYKLKLIFIGIVFLFCIWIALPSLGIFPEVEDADGNGILSEVDFSHYHRQQLAKNAAFVEKWDMADEKGEKDGILDDAEWSRAYESERETLGLDRDPRSLRKLFFEKKVTLGLDLQGGMDLIYLVEGEDPAMEAKDYRALVRKTIQVLKRRVDILGITEPVIRPYDEHRIRVQLAGRFDENQVKSIIGQTDLLKLQEVADMDESPFRFGTVSEEFEIVRGVAEASKDGSQKENPMWYKLVKKPILLGDQISRAFPGFDEFGKPEIRLDFKSEGAKIFADETKRLTGRHIAIVLGGDVYMAPYVKQQILDGGCRIEGNFDLDYAKSIVDVLAAGSLPAKLTAEHENRIGATLGRDSVNRGMRAGQIGFILVFVLMLLWYKFPGLVSNTALLFNLLLVVSCMVIFGATLTLPGIAGLILTVGMAVDANVIIFERIKEEMQLGKSARAAIDAGFAKAFTAIIDANVTSLLTCLILFNFGSGPIKGFALTLATGIVCSLFTAVFVVKVLVSAYYNNTGKSLVL
jgi:protein-export membrane protein SecD